MAIKQTKKDLDEIFKLLFSGKDRVDNQIDKLLRLETHIFTFAVRTLFNQLKMHSESLFTGQKKETKTSASTGKTYTAKTKEYSAYKRMVKKEHGGIEPRFAPFEGKEFEETLMAFCKDLLVKYKEYVHANSNIGYTLIKQTGNTIRFSLKAQSDADKPYNNLRDLKAKLGNELIESNVEYKKLFSRAREYTREGGGFGALAAIGHEVSVAQEKADILTTSLGNADQALKIAGVNADIMGGVRQIFKEANLTFSIENDRQFDYKAGTFNSRQPVKSNMEGSFLNSVLKANKGYGGEEAEQKIIDAVHKAFLEAQKRIDEYYSKIKGVKKYANQESSPSIMHTVKTIVISEALNSKAAKKKNSRLASKYKKVKKPASRPTTKTKKKTTLNAKEYSGTSAIAGVKTPRDKPTRRGTTESGSLAPLMALLNAKLPETVAKNMGPPGLENQTGRFASSVKVTDVTQTAKGFPSFGYTYRKNPYQVFEMGQGDPRWATPDRDPRKVIDMSIREIAAQQAIGRFYTRRV